jgi:U32 family peptidase
MIFDGVVRDLGDKRYLLSPQDLAAVEEIPGLMERGVVSFKIEGRLKAPEYVAAVCQVYRRAIDAVLAEHEYQPTDADRYQLEMTFSRGLFSGWMHGVDHQQLVSARYGKKRGPFVGRIEAVGEDFVEVHALVPLKPGDGVVFDTGGDTNDEQGGRIWQVRGERLFFERGRIRFANLKRGDRVWKTDDPELNKRLRQSFTARIEPRRQSINIAVRGSAGTTLSMEGAGVSVSSAMPLQAARTAPLSTEKLRDHLGRFGDAPFALGELRNELDGEVILPISELNRLRRAFADALGKASRIERAESPMTWRDVLGTPAAGTERSGTNCLSVLVRTMEQLDAALASGVQTVLVDFEDIRRYAEAVERVRASATGAQIFLATPRIQKAGEQGFFRLIENAGPDGVLIRNLGAIAHFAGHPRLRRIGDFSLNIANPLTAQHFISAGLERVTISYDLNIEQVLDLLGAAPPEWFEITLHQHMPMFHMEHCVFAAFMSKGSTFLDCGRPCEKHKVHLRDRVGTAHPLRADVGCRNTLFNAVPQTGARFFEALRAAGLRHYRVELLEEDEAETRRVIGAYQSILTGARDGETLWRELRAQSQLGVTQGTL